MLLAAITVPIALALTACSSGPAPTSTTSTNGIVGQVCCVASEAGDPTAINGVSTSYNGWDTAFLSWLVPHDAVSGQMAALATTQTTNPAILQLAGTIDDQQSARYPKLAALATAWGQPVPSTDPNAATGHDHGGGNSEAGNAAALAPLKGSTFDRQFLEIMLKHHQAAIPVAHATISNGVNPQAKAMAQQVIAEQQTQLTAMQSLLATAK